jgi:hypothetical protein
VSNREKLSLDASIQNGQLAPNTENGAERGRPGEMVHFPSAAPTADKLQAVLP